MSGPRYSIIPANAVWDRRLTHTDLRVLTALGSYTDKQGWCFPSQQEVADKVGVHRQKVCSAIKVLIDCGYVMSRPRTDPKRGKIGCEYRVVIDTQDVETTPMSVDTDNGSAPRRIKRRKPMSVQTDNGQKADVRSGGQRKADTASDPMSVAADNGPDVRSGGHPMSVAADIPISLTFPINVPTHTGGTGLFGEEPETPPASKPKKAKKPAPYTDEFAAFWNLWPRNIRANSDKPTSAARWKAARDRYDAETLMLAARHYLGNTKPDDALPGPWKPRTCQAQVFLNGKLDAAIEDALEGQAKRDPSRRNDGDQVCINGQWCWPDGTPVAESPQRGSPR